MTDPAQKMSLSELYGSLSDEAKIEADTTSKEFTVSLVVWAAFLGIAIFFPLVLMGLVPPGENDRTIGDRPRLIMTTPTNRGLSPIIHIHEQGPNSA